MTESRRTPMNVSDAAKYLNISEGWLNKRRISGGGPEFYKIGGRILYSPDKLDAWLEAHTRSSTSCAMTNVEAGK